MKGPNGHVLGGPGGVLSTTCGLRMRLPWGYSCRRAEWLSLSFERILCAICCVRCALCESAEYHLGPAHMLSFFDFARHLYQAVVIILCESRPHFESVYRLSRRVSRSITISNVRTWCMLVFDACLGTWERWTLTCKLFICNYTSLLASMIRSIFLF